MNYPLKKVTARRDSNPLPSRPETRQGSATYIRVLDSYPKKYEILTLKRLLNQLLEQSVALFVLHEEVHFELAVAVAAV